MSPLFEPALISLLVVVAGAAGVDLALTILILGIAPMLGWAAPPGDLIYLQAPSVIAAGLAMYLAEAAMERHPAGFSVWHTFQRWVRLLGLILIAEMGTAGMSPDTRWPAALLMVIVGLASYVAASGWQGMVILRQLPRRTQALAAGGIDVAFAALLVLALERPIQALLGLVAVTALVTPRLPIAVRGHRAVIDAGRSWIRSLFGPGEWVEPRELPRNVHGALASMEDEPISTPRGTPALLLSEGLQRGWLLAGPGGAWFVTRRSRALRLRLREQAVGAGDPLYARLPVTVGERDADLLVHRDGPGRKELEREIPSANRNADATG
jgi:hypothetical protein